MRIELTKNRKINGKPRKKGDAVIVRKGVGERMISEGVANRMVTEPENRIVGPPSNRGVRRFSGHKVFGRNP